MKFVLALLAVLAVGISAAPADTTKKPVPTPPGPHKSHNFRNDFDQVLFAFVEEHLIRAEQTLFHVQFEVQMFHEHTDAHLKERILLQINHETTMLQETLAHINSQKDSRQDFNDLELYFVEKMQNDSQLLIKHFNHIKAALQKK